MMAQTMLHRTCQLGVGRHGVIGRTLIRNKFLQFRYMRKFSSSAWISAVLQHDPNRRLPLSILKHSPRILRITASLQQRIVLQLCENENRWKHFVSFVPENSRSFMESFRRDFLMQFSSSFKEEGNGKANSDKQKNAKESNEEDGPKPRNAIFQFLTMLAVMYLLLRGLGSRIEFITWEDFVEKYLLTGEVEYITIDSKTMAVEAVVNDRSTTGEYRRSLVAIPQSRQVSFENRLRELEDQLQLPVNQRIEIRYVSNTSSDLMSFLLNALVISIIVGNLIREFTRPRPKGGDGKQDQVKPPPGLGPLFDPTQGVNQIRSALSSSSPAEMKKATQGMTFKDVAGLKAVKQEVVEFVDYLKRPERFVRLGAKLPRGALLLGPPGCGKTLLVKALANEADVPFFFMAGSEFVEVIGGVGASRMRQLFLEARQSAPSIIFIDEIDTIGRNRSGQGGGGESGNSEVEQTLNQLLVEMDGMDTEKGVIVFAATNRSEVLDRALLRPGRFDRIITIDLPTLEERREIFELHLGNYKVSNSPRKLAKKLANFTPGMTGADIANVCNEAALAAVRLEHREILPEDFDSALHRVMVGAEKKSRVLGPKERQRVAAHEAGHAVIGWILKYTDPILRVSIVPRVIAPLGYSQTAPQDKKLYSEDDLFDRMCMLLGGRVSESFYFNDLSSGAEDDLKRVTDMAYTQIRQFGMNPRVGHVSFDYSKEDHQYRLIPYSKHLQTIMDEEVNYLIKKALKRTDSLIKENWEALDKIKNALLEKETLSYEDVESLIGPRPHGRKLNLDDIRWANLNL